MPAWTLREDEATEHADPSQGISRCSGPDDVVGALTGVGRFREGLHVV